jgi:hypothetical protein
MATSYARERLVQLTIQLEAQTALIASDDHSQAVGTETPTRSAALDGQAARLRQTLQKVRQLSKKRKGDSRFDRGKIIDLLKQVGETQAAATVANVDDDVTDIRALEWLLVAQLTLLAYSTTVETLMGDAVRMDYEIDYWAQVEGEGYQTGLYLLQSTPLLCAPLPLCPSVLTFMCVRSQLFHVASPMSSPPFYNIPARSSSKHRHYERQNFRFVAWSEQPSLSHPRCSSPLCFPT